MSGSGLMQLIGMARYEFRMHWRRRGLLLLLWAMLVVVVISLLVSSSTVTQVSSQVSDSGWARTLVTSALIMTMWSPIGLGLAFILPLVAAETIPLDRQYGVRELLNALPISTNEYLLGKLLGLWAAVLSAMGLLMVVIAVVWWLRVGAFDLVWYAEVWVVGIASVVILNGSLGVLIPAMLSSRRQAILVTLGGMVAISVLFSKAFDYGGTTNGYDWGAMASLARTPIVHYYLMGAMSVLSPTTPVPPFQTVLLTIGVGGAEVAVLFVLERLLLGWQETRQ